MDKKKSRVFSGRGRRSFFEDDVFLREGGREPPNEAATRHARARFHRTKRLRTVREHAKAPPPGGAHPRRAALVALRRARNNLGVSLLITFLFAPAVSKRKVAMEAETQSVRCFRANNVRPCKRNFVRIHIEIEKRYSAFSFAHVGPKEKAWQKENGREDVSPSADGEEGSAPSTCAHWRGGYGVLSHGT